MLLLFLGCPMFSLSASLHAEPLSEVPAPPLLEICPPHVPVTNTCVEAGLRARRERLREQFDFKGSDTARHLKLAEMLIQQGDPNGAIEDYLAAIQLNPAMAEAYRGMGGVYLDQHEWNKAETALQSAAKLNDRDSFIFYWALLAQHKFHDAGQALTTATQLDPTDAEIFSDLGLAYMAQGRSREASRVLRHAIRLQPDFPDAHFHLELVETYQHRQDQLIHETSILLHILFRRK
jgi:tetratricopeptide (TPR) repeat protein